MLKLRHLAAATVSASLTLALTGCGLGDPAPAGVDPMSQTGTLTGTIYGGNVPIINATINLYQSGSGGYGKAVGATGGPKLLATTTSRIYDSEFSFTKDADGTTGTGVSDGTTNVWACPTDSDPLIYILAVGGNPNGGSDTTVNNNAIVQAGAIAFCDQVTGSSRVNLTEVSTAAFATTFGQFMYPGTSTPGGEGLSSNGALPYGSVTTGTTVASAPQGALGLFNAFNIYSNDLITISTGFARTSNTFSNSGSTTVSNIVVTATPESAKLLTEANILSACINSSNTATTPNAYCTELFDGAQKPYRSSSTAFNSTFPTAVDTLQAAMYMALNPSGLNSTGTTTVSGGGACSTIPASTNIACLYSLRPRNVAFSGDLSSAPNDWTIDVTFSEPASTGSGSNTTPDPTNACYTSGGVLTTGGFISGPTKSAVDASGYIYWINDVQNTRSLAQMTAWGVPMLCAKPGLAGNSRGLAADNLGNIWPSFNYKASSLYSQTPPAAALTTFTDNYYNSAGGNTADAPYDVFSDGIGNVYFTTQYNGGNLRYFPQAAQGKLPTDQAALSNINGAGTTNGLLSIAKDSNGNFWLPSNTSTSVAELKITGGTANVVTKFTSGTQSGGSESISIFSATLPTVGQTVLVAGFGNAKACTNGTTFTVATVTATNFTGTCSATGAGGATNAVDSGARWEVLPTFAANSGTGDAPTFGAAADSAGNVYIATDAPATANATTPRLQKWTGSSGTPTLTASSSGYLGGLNGAANVWISDGYPETGSSYGISEIATSGSNFYALSPAATNSGATCSTAGCPVSGGFYKSDLSGPIASLSIDPSGNVWAPINSTTSNSVVMLVGAAVPVVTPIAAGIANGTLATKP